MLRIVAALVLAAAGAGGQTASFQAWPCDRALLAAETVPGFGEEHFLDCQDDGESVSLHVWAKNGRIAQRVSETVSTEVPARGFGTIGYSKFDRYVGELIGLRARMEEASPWRRLAKPLGGSSSADREIRALEIRNRTGGVTVVVADVAKPAYQVFGLTGERLPVSTCQAFGPIEGTLFVDCSGEEVHLDVEIPEALPVGAETQSGPISVVGYPLELRVTTASGAIDLQLDPELMRVDGWLLERPRATSLSPGVDIRRTGVGPFERRLVNRPANGCSWPGGDLFHPMYRDDHFSFGSYGQIGDMNPALISSRRADPFMTAELPMGISSRHCQERDWRGVVRIRAGRPVALRVQDPGAQKQ